MFDKHLSYCFYQYVVLPVAFVGLLSKHYNYNSSEPEAYTIYVMFLLCMSGLLGIIKIIVMIVKGIRNPINYNYIIVPSTKELDI